MTREEAIKFANYASWLSKEPEVREFYRMCEQALRAQQKFNAPLTLEELREMDGEPVWCAFSDGRDCNMIIQWHNSEFFRSFECGFLLAEEYGKSWQAYRRKPEEV